MKVIGLTGGIATGKSTISNIVRKFGIPVIDADKIARDIVKIGEDTILKLAEEFGPNILMNDGSLDRNKLGNIVFGNSDKLKKLNEITHPIIKARIQEEVEKYRNQNVKCCFIDVPLLIEGGYVDIVDVVLLVYVDRATELERLMKRNNITREDAIKRVDSQMDIEQKKKYADFIIDNRFSIEYSMKQLLQFLEVIC